MTLVNMNEILKMAMQKGCAIGAFNVVDINSLHAVINSAVRLKSPVIISVAEIHFQYIDVEELAPVIKAAADKAPIPLALHLDHGQSLEAVMKAVQCGFTSIMFDGSQLPLEENIAKTAEIVRYAHAAGISVEGELGHVGGAEGQLEDQSGDSLFTDPSEASLFVKKTRVDALAVAVGSAHGVYKRKPRLDFNRLKKIKDSTRIPLVLHGGSGIPDNDIKKSIECGICKINVYTELSQNAVGSVRKKLAEYSGISYPELMRTARRAMENVVAEKIEIFGSKNFV
ncbi:MAG: class II fructose-bisphosphate aldolase [Desulfotomaculum sp.]|nr:class II fructose-bisphosphate aldolase [Desulfotomaculum sp.]